MVVRCRYCGEMIKLNEDSMEARARGFDPHQQLRKHLLGHPIEMISHCRKVGWLIDALAFLPAGEPERWRTHLIALLDHFQGPN